MDGFSVPVQLERPVEGANPVTFYMCKFCFSTFAPLTEAITHFRVYHPQLHREFGVEARSDGRTML
eukprot:5215164-Karenia_brevis.AAC.1